MSGKRDFFKEINGVSSVDWFKVNSFPSTDDSIDRIYAQNHSQYGARVLGLDSNGSPLIINDEQRTHTHVIGTTRVGKSKFLEHLIREDIDKGHGICFIDSSEGGQTAYNILRYCAYKDYDKVIFIDPHHTYTFGKIAPINPFGEFPYNPYEAELSAEKVWDIIQIQFQQKDSSETPVIKQYLPAIVRVLHKARMTLAESLYFTQPVYVSQREEIFAKLPVNDSDVLMLRSAFGRGDLYKEFRPTGRRVLDLLHSTLKFYFGSSKGLDFTRLIADKWAVIVNLYPQRGFGKSPARFLGTAIIEEIDKAMDILTGNPLSKNPWEGRFYLYVDEVGRYANRNIADMLQYKVKTGLILTLAHQNLSQIEDSFVREAVLELTSTKVIFRMESDDSQKLAKMVYGGEVSDRDAARYIKQLARQNCIIKLPAQDAVSVRVPDVTSDFKVDLTDYLKRLYEQDGYVSRTDIETELKTRVNQFISYQNPEKKSYGAPRTSDTPSQPRTKTAKKPVSKTTAPRQSANREEQANVFSELREDQVSYPANEEKQPPEK
jgi:hypothetical protein